MVSDNVCLCLICLCLSRIGQLLGLYNTYSSPTLHMSVCPNPFCPLLKTVPETIKVDAPLPTFPFSLHWIVVSTFGPEHHNTQPAHPHSGIRHPPLMTTCSPVPYAYLPEEDQSVATHVISSQDYTRVHMDQ